MNTNTLKALFKQVSYRVFFRTKNNTFFSPPFAPDLDTDILYGGFSIHEITAAANSIKDIYKRPMCLLNAGYGHKETASLLGISELKLARQIEKGHRLFMKSLQKNRKKPASKTLFSKISSRFLL